ncbi:histidyl-tRNA synthetase [Formosa sp. Hel3_A1_48]|jgi:histidyl-tRNA synthetase|uniref:histidine--tRNA ligase n=1 Tax=Formosa sp. Hel3_A1_48 TaxID=1336795 RepID=UPI00084E1865|nr:histidine--tRNA ligase [Formosa sp. Hel3_A1_48]AOR26899.1 histidyl-tRNA synthetase [Formosa sp. Hel3_A1_48]
MATKPRIAKGTRDFNSQQIAQREYIFSTIKSNFKAFGFAPIETPSFELSETLLGKYGDEGDRLIFKILNSGDKVKKADLKALEEGQLARFSNSLSEKALRYDLTVPFARYVAQYQNDITFPFKRYQIQPVWRADRPQKGRFQEFYQCDADAVGSDSLWQEVEFIQLYDAVFTDLKLEGVTIKINNRKILAAIAERIGAQDKLIDFTVALDKLDKIGAEKVKEEMLLKGIPSEGIQTLEPLFNMVGNFDSQLNALKLILGSSEVGTEGISELEFISNTINSLGLKTATLKLDVTLARGLNYYTGAIFEVSAPAGVAMGSIGGGGRYDDLTSIFGLKGVSGVGISFGLDRIAMVLEELNLFPENSNQAVQVLFANFGSDESLYSYKAIQSLRSNGIIAELYPEASKLKKQITYANKRNIPFVVLVGDEEMFSKRFTVKDMKSGSQESLNFQELLACLKTNTQ